MQKALNNDRVVQSVRVVITQRWRLYKR